MTFVEVLENTEAYSLVEQIEELIGESEQILLRIRAELVLELMNKYGYEYVI